MHVVVLNDRDTFSTIDGCRIVGVPDDSTTEDIEAILHGEPGGRYIKDQEAVLDQLASFLWANPEQFPGGADTCEALDTALKRSGRQPENYVGDEYHPRARTT
jgi:hypothetical protein